MSMEDEDEAQRARVDIETRVLATLEATGVPYEVIECDPDFADTFPFSERYGYPVEMSANTIVIASKAEPRQYVACVVVATRRVDANNAVKKRMGVKKVSFATAEETVALTGMQIGGVTPLALPDELPVWVDAEVMAQEAVILGGGSRAMKVKVAPAVFERLPRAEVVAGLTIRE